MLKNIILIISLVFALVSCDKDFLVKESALDSTNELVLSSFTGLENATVGAYAPLCTTEWYGRDFVIAADLKGGNGKISPKTSGRFVNEYLWINNANATINMWEYAYRTITSACNIINTIDGGFSEVGVEQSQIDQLKGEALFLRALGHWDMVRFYAQQYSSGRDNPGVPIVLVTQNEYPPRNTVGEVYDQVVLDLQAAEELLPAVNPRDNSMAWATKYAAKALLAKVYLYMEDWQNAAAYATDVINNGGFSLFSAAEYTTYDNDGYWGGDGTGSEIIFQVDGSEGNFYHGYWDAISYILNPDGYADIGASQDLIGLYEAGDVRADLFQSDSEFPSDFWTSKYPGRLGGVPRREYNLPVLRLAEMYLIRAEAITKGASISGTSAVANINAIRTHRGLAPVGTISLAEIYNERRRELCFEGNEMFDLARTERSLVRTDYDGALNKDIDFVAGGTPLQNYLWALPIPLAEINANVNVVQNEGY